MSAFVSSSVQKTAAPTVTKHGGSRRVETHTATITLMGAGSDGDSDSSSSSSGDEENSGESNPYHNDAVEMDAQTDTQTHRHSALDNDANDEDDGLYNDYDNISITTMVINGNIDDNSLPWLCDSNKNVQGTEACGNSEDLPAGQEAQIIVNKVPGSSKISTTNSALSIREDNHRTKGGEFDQSPAHSGQEPSDEQCEKCTRVRSVTVASGEIRWTESRDDEEPALEEDTWRKMKPERFNPFDKDVEKEVEDTSAMISRESGAGQLAGDDKQATAHTLSSSQVKPDEDIHKSTHVKTLISASDGSEHRASVCSASGRVQRTSVSSNGTPSLSEWTVSSWGVGSNEITNAELGMAEDHFSQPEGHFGQSSVEELEMGILNCKRLIFEAPPDSERQKCLVNKLVKLRLRLQEAKEGPEEDEPNTKCVVGHRFKKTDSSSTKHFCEKCTGVIWGVLQTWYRCSGCGFCCHAKCLNLITRMCARVKVEENAEYILSICPEKGLAGQSYRCAECRVPLSFNLELRMKFAKESNDWLDAVLTSPEPRQCDYTGLYFCEKCHWNDTMPMPARVLRNWDLEPKKVCRASKQYLKLMYSRPVIRINDINPMLFSFVDELNEVKKLREELLIMKRYFLSCKGALDSKLLLQLQARQHFVDHSDMYSLKDLIDIAADTLLPELAKIHTSFAQHIKSDCQLCQAKGYVCELCDAQEVLFPFDNHAIVCSQCSTVLHRHCFAKKNRECPKCLRIVRRTTLQETQMSH